MNVRQYNGVNRGENEWHSLYFSVYLIVLSDIHFTALFTSLYCLTFTLLLCLPHCNVWHSFYCSVYLIVLSDIHLTALFTSLYCLTFIFLLCLPHCIVWHLKWGKLSSKMNVKHYNGVNRAVKWISDNTMR
jgi:hypothetical protein